MSLPTDSTQPRLASGCRWSNSNGEDKTLLFPEGALRLQGTGKKIVELCDGQRTFSEIVNALQADYNASDPAQIRQDVAAFLEQLRQKRILDY
ncbi:MAG TPA: pyrroloquinoline quinone biosynthesis peptide chaperone PqqD [Terriglobales bacterium]|jgi:pyrroloquinoline quinone biosynthesis protein D|nr:pyrroloquinoline quinone biosynthesis peptide chaperone PqqD [Terriglobales bacterium]